MNDINDIVFSNLFKEVCQKCFGHPLTEPLSETDSKLLANTLLEQTGLVIGVKSIKNYSQYIMHPEGKKENPSVATLDTFARYVLNAPAIDEIKRKNQESHHPYWFRYKSRFLTEQPKTEKPVRKKRPVLILAGVIVIVLALLSINYLPKTITADHFTEEFTSVQPDSLTSHGWILKKEETAYWNKRNATAGHLSLFTLIGDNWPDATQQLPAGIKNLLIRKIEQDCFSVEIHLSHFIPFQSWQQAGILLSEDSTFSGKALRLSIGYNDFFGGYSRPAEIIIQVVGSTDNSNLSRPEEIAHIPLFSGNPQSDSLIQNNLLKAALKIEKKGNHFRFLYTNGRMESFAFKEAARGDFSIQPDYIGIFAMQGFATTQHPMPVQFDSFKLIGMDCAR